MKLSIILATLLLGSANFPQSGNAKADKVNGLDIFIYSTPLNNYEVIDSGKITNRIQVRNFHLFKNPDRSIMDLYFWGSKGVAARYVCKFFLP